MNTSNSLEAQQWGIRLYTFPKALDYTSSYIGTTPLVGDPILGNDSGALAQVGTNLSALDTPPIDVSWSDPVNYDGSEVENERYERKTVTIPVVVYEATAEAAADERARIIKEMRPRTHRAWLDIRRPSAATPGATRQNSFRLPRLIFRGASEPILEYAEQNYWRFNLQFTTVGHPHFEGLNGATEPVVVSSDAVVYTMPINNSGDIPTPGRFRFRGLENAGCVLELRSDNDPTTRIFQVVDNTIGDTFEFTIDMDRKKTAVEVWPNITPGSKLIEFPPGQSFVDIYWTAPPAGGSGLVQCDFVTRHSTC